MYSDIIALMRPEFLLLAQIVFLLIYDLFVCECGKKYFDTIACGLFVVCSVISFYPFGGVTVFGDCFGGMFSTSEMSQIVKMILCLGALLVFLQSYRLELIGTMPF